ncbi:unnamed protein product [Trichogramma brassicae]|uniref:Uncharacterized protein n=1 Tax=Trichogramma brassicae TaxID=86971 RepID=A0A6H5IPM4_9HYME|nr:unnamed protein product [Trichogramma brassicae]
MAANATAAESDETGHDAGKKLYSPEDSSDDHAAKAQADEAYEGDAAAKVPDVQRVGARASAGRSAATATNDDKQKIGRGGGSVGREPTRQNRPQDSTARTDQTQTVEGWIRSETRQGEAATAATTAAATTKRGLGNGIDRGSDGDRAHHRCDSEARHIGFRIGEISRERCHRRESQRAPPRAAPPLQQQPRAMLLPPHRLVDRCEEVASPEVPRPPAAAIQSHANRIRQRHNERKPPSTTTTTEASKDSATPAPTPRRRTYFPKPPQRTHPVEHPSKQPTENGPASAPAAKKIAAHPVDARKPNRPRSRYRAELSTSTEAAATTTTTTASPSTTPATTSTTTTTTTPAPSTTLAPTAAAPAILSSEPTYEGSFSPSSAIPSNFGISTPLHEANLPATTFQPAIRWSSTSTEATLVDENPIEIGKRNDEVNEKVEDTVGDKRKATKEDFFNHGLGFRGRTPAEPTADEAPIAIVSSSTSAPTLQADNAPRGNPGWNLRRRPGHLSDDSKPDAAPEQASGDQTREITSVTSSTSKVGRRGNKVHTKAPGSGLKDDETEGDNYPPEFKARLAELRNTEYENYQIIGQLLGTPTKKPVRSIRLFMRFLTIVIIIFHIVQAPSATRVNLIVYK